MKIMSRFVTLLAVSATLAGAAFAQNPVYRVKDLVVDKVAPSAAEARQQGITEARTVGAQRLIEKLTLPEDRAGKGIDTAAVARLYQSSVTQGEFKSTSVSGGIRASGLVTWVFRDNEVRAYLDQRGVPYVDQQAGMALIVPVAGANVNAQDWASQWVTRTASGVVGKSDETSLTPYVAATQGYTQRPTTADVQGEISAARATHGVIAEVYMQGPQYYVQLTDMRPNVTNTTIGRVGPFVSLASAQTGAVAEMERAWKASSVVRSSGSTSVTLIAKFQDIQQWTRIRKGLETSRLVSDLNVESLTVAGADITLSYAGRPDQLQADLRSRGVDLRSGDGGGWLLQVSGAQ